MATPLSTKLTWEAANPLWAQSLNPVIANPTNNIQIISNFPLKTGVNIINHMLGHTLIGWFLTDIQGIADIYRSAPFNALTLTLTVSAPVTVSIGVF
jgi:hypothetical protein